MSKSQMIAKLEALLARVHARAALPREPVRRPMSALALSGPSAPMTLSMSGATGAPSPRRATPTGGGPASTPTLSFDDDVALVFRGPQREVNEPEIVVEVDAQEVTADAVRGVVADEPPIPESAESRERLVAALPSPPDTSSELLALADDAPEAVESPPAGGLDVVDEDENAERPPTSSRRPLEPAPEERLADIAFGKGEPAPPRHTPPPESGRLPAAPVGGPDLATIPADLDAEGTVDTIVVDVPGPQTVGDVWRAARPIEPESFLPRLVADSDPADVLGKARRFSPPTFFALLDASLAL